MAALSQGSRLFMQTKQYTPVFSSPDIHKIFHYSLPLDTQKLLRCVEVVLFPGAKVEILHKINSTVVEIKTNEYPGESLYVDGRFLEAALDDKPRQVQCPPLEIVMRRMEEALGAPYIWGGNCKAGIPDLAKFFPIPENVDDYTRTVWTLKGVDCTGLLYEATEGTIPRNSSQLLSFGEPVAIEGKKSAEIEKQLVRGDMIVWRGHIIIVEGETVIESNAAKGGVVRIDLRERLEEVMKECQPVDLPSEHTGKPVFGVRRWHPDVLKIG